MDDMIYMLQEALDKYKDAPGDDTYVGVVQTLLICMKYNLKLWSLGRESTDEDGAQLLTPGMIAASDGGYYFALCTSKDDLGEHTDDMQEVQLSLNALATQIAGDGALGGICFNPWSGACFVPRDQIIRLLESFAASMYE